ncbi:MAG: hypothetical protein MJ086_03410 [Lachnospiraceae bacterium]|nr:hypothetical protein [Lachnospiraceae bacterium]
MIEKTVLNYLIGKNITGIMDNVFMEVPETPPSEYLLVEKTGGGEQNRIEKGMLAIKSISKTSLLMAAELNEAVKDVMRDMADETDIYSCKLNSDYNFTDTTTKEYRYQAVFNFSY